MPKLANNEDELQARVAALEATVDYLVQALAQPSHPGIQAPIVGSLDHAISVFRNRHSGTNEIATRAAELAQGYFERANAIKNSSRGPDPLPFP